MCSQMGYRLRASTPRPGGPELGTNRNLTTEDLGTSTISGVTVEGKRVTRVIPEGWVGNDRAFTSTEEVWHSTELDVDVQVIRADPRVGTRTTTMTELSLNEPDPGYFQVPEGYRVTRRMSNVQPLTPLPEESGATFPAGMMPPR
jgi:hypothetical protein